MFNVKIHLNNRPSTMNEKNKLRLWVIKFCLKLVYPKYNYYTFLVFLAIKYRIWYYRRQLTNKNMDQYLVKVVPHHLARYLLKEKLENNLSVLQDKCIIISKEQFIQLSSENLFYLDNGVLWLTIKLAMDIKIRKQNNTHNNFRKFNQMTSEMHKKLWTDDSSNSLNNVRIVPLIGSKLVSENVALITCQEYYNTVSSFGLDNMDKLEVTFHPIPSIECSPKIASMAEVSLILNDYDLSNEFIKEVLSNYFVTPKLVSVNDVFTIDLLPEITAKYHYKYLDLVESTEKLYFKCNKLHSNDELKSDTKTDTTHDNIIKPLFIVKNVTQLTLGENIHAIKPKDEYFKLQVKGKSNLQILHLCPTGHKQKFNQILETITPFLTREINDLSSSLTSPITPMILLTGSTGSGRHLLVKTLAKYCGTNYLAIDYNTLQSSTAKQTESKISFMIQKAKTAAPVIVLLDNFEVFAIDPENNEDCRIMEYFTNTITDLYQNYSKNPIIFIAISEKKDLKPNILRMFLEKFHLAKLNVQQRYEMLEWFASVMQLNIDGKDYIQSEEISEDIAYLSKTSKNILQRVAAKTETFLQGDLDTLLHFALRESYLKQHDTHNQLLPGSDLHLVKEDDFNSALESIRNLQSQHLDAPKIPKVYWDDIGGLENLKKELLKTIEFPIKYPHLFKNSNLKRSGILLYGPPGCGKTLVAKAVSTELNVSFLSVKGPELLNMYIGQSEENVRKVFESARASSPCIVFLDELDALAPRRGAAGDSGGASDRVVSQLLAELDGVAEPEDAASSSFVFVMGATNRPDLLEQSLLRPGRLDKLTYVGPYCGQREKTCVLTALCRNIRLREEVQLEAVAAALPERCTGADLLQVVSTARSAAVRSIVAQLQAGTIKESDLSPNSIILGVSELWQGVEAFRPSVTDEELAYYESLTSQM